MKANSEAKQLAEKIKEVALKAGADLVGIVSASAIDVLPSIWVGWTVQEYTKKTTDILSDAKSIVVIGYHVWDDMLEIAIQKGENGFIPATFHWEFYRMRSFIIWRRRGTKQLHQACSPTNGWRS